MRGSVRVARARRLGLAAIGAVVVVAGLAPGAAPATEKIDRAQIVDLLASIPQSYRAECEISSPSDTDPVIGPLKAHVIAELRCHPGSGADVAFYTRFDDAASMNAAFDGYNPQPGDGEHCPGAGTWDQDGVDAGRWHCYLADNLDGAAKAATVVWTHDDTNTLASAYRHDEDLTAIDDWWSSDEAGPLAEPDDAGLPAVLSTTRWLANGRALKSLVPRSHRASCTPVPLTEDALGNIFSPRREWLLGGLRCRPDGVESAYYFRFTSGGGGVAPLDAALTNLADRNVDEADARDRLGTISCDGQGTWSRDSEDVGEYACWHATDDDGDFVVMVWSDTEQEVMGYARVDGTDATPLLRFWRDEAGPLGAGR